METPQEFEPQYTVPEAAEILHVLPGKVWRLCRSGWLRHHRLGRATIRIPKTALVEFLDRTRVEPAGGQ